MNFILFCYFDLLQWAPALRDLAMRSFTITQTSNFAYALFDATGYTIVGVPVSCVG